MAIQNLFKVNESKILKTVTDSLMRSGEEGSPFTSKWFWQPCPFEFIISQGKAEMSMPDISTTCLKRRRCLSPLTVVEAGNLSVRALSFSIREKW